MGAQDGGRVHEAQRRDRLLHVAAQETVVLLPVIAIIPAKGSSARIPRKNIRSFHGKPIISYSIEAAKRSELFSRIIVSTDDNEIAEVSLGYGAKVFRRTQEFCSDRYGPLDVAANVVAMLRSDSEYACVIYATAPFLDSADLVRGFRQFSTTIGIDYAISVYGADNKPIMDAAQFVWARTAALISKNLLAGTRTILVPIHPSRVCDINTLEDWERAEEMYAALAGQMICGDVFAPCEHDHELRTDVPHPDMIHFRCPKCGESLPT